MAYQLDQVTEECNQYVVLLSPYNETKHRSVCNVLNQKC